MNGQTFAIPPIRESRWRAWVARLVLAMACVLLPSTFAHAEEPNATPPRDAPLVLEPSSVHIPPIPPSYRVRDLGWLRIAFVPSAEERALPLIRDAEEIKTKLTDALGQAVLEHVEVRIGRTPEEMAELAPSDLPPPAYASGVAYQGLHLVVLTLSAPYTSEAPDLEEVFRHELTHVALEDAVLDHHVPRWFNEGLAIHESGEKSFVRAQTLWNATVSKAVMPLADLDRNFPSERNEVNIAYAESADFVRFLLRRTDRERFASLIDRVRHGDGFDRALADAYGTDVRKLEFQWREELSRRFTLLPLLTGGSFLWILVIVALVAAYVKKRRRAKATLERWAREEAAFDAALRGEPIARDDDMPPIALEPSITPPKVEHDGSWHTLH